MTVGLAVLLAFPERTARAACGDYVIVTDPNQRAVGHAAMPRPEAPPEKGASAPIPLPCHCTGPLCVQGPLQSPGPPVVPGSPASETDLPVPATLPERQGGRRLDRLPAVVPVAGAEAAVERPPRRPSRPAGASLG